VAGLAGEGVELQETNGQSCQALDLPQVPPAAATIDSPTIDGYTLAHGRFAAAQVSRYVKLRCAPDLATAHGWHTARLAPALRQEIYLIDIESGHIFWVLPLPESPIKPVTHSRH
jgi:hypothetical protein